MIRRNDQGRLVFGTVSAPFGLRLMLISNLHATTTSIGFHRFSGVDLRVNWRADNRVVARARIGRRRRSTQ